MNRDKIVQDTIRLLQDRGRATIRATCCGRPTVCWQYRPWHYTAS